MRGRISVHPRGFGFVLFDGDGGSAFVPPPELNRFLADDVVDCEVVPGGREGRLEARALALVERPRRHLFGAVVEHGGRAFLQVDRLVANTDWPLEGAAAAGADVVARIDGARAVVERVVAGEEAEIERLLARHDLAGAHAPAVAAAAAGAPGLALEGRRDLRGAVTVTIDGPSTKDIDDALLAFPPDDDGGLRVVVAIADVGAAVAEGSPLDLDARARATSIYLPGHVFPMLPRALSEDRLSLLPGVDRAALTAELRIDPEGAVTAVDVHEAVIRSTARLTYDDVARFLDAGDAGAVPAETHEALHLLRAAAARLSQARSARGGNDVEREEISVRLDEQGAPTGIERRTTDVAHVMVERLMVAANEAVARFLVERGLPGVFRVHDAPTAERTAALADGARALGLVAGFSSSKPLTPQALTAFERQFRGTRDERAVEAMLRRLLGPARYTSTPAPHFGLAAPLYLHFTSPIRRYADLVVHRILRRYLRGERPGASTAAGDEPASTAALDALCATLNDKARRAARAESERERVLVARLLKKSIGETRRVVVVGNKPQGALVQVDGALALLPGPARPLGQALDVVIAAVDEELGRIDVSLPTS